MLKTLSIAALMATFASASFAGSLNTEFEQPAESDDGVFVPVAGSGIGIPVIIGGVAAAAAIGALVADDNDSGVTTTTEDD